MNYEIEDNYEHAELNKVYIKENIILEELESENSQFSHGCLCLNECNSEQNCECFSTFGENYKQIYADQESISNKEYVLNEDRFNLPIYECNVNCSCNAYCKNRLVQHGPRKNLQIIKCDSKKGLGLTTKQLVRRGMFICEYAGEVITKEIAEIRFNENRKHHRMNYILEFNENFGNVKYRTIVDPSIYGNIGRYLNHSCEPNCSLISVRINEFIPKICIFASEDIHPNEELTFDYGEYLQNFESKQYLTKCLCKKPKCRTWLPFLI